MTQMSDTPAGLVAELVRANVDAAAKTQESLLDFHKRRETRMAGALVEIVTAIDTSQIVDRRLLALLDKGTILAGISTAEQVLRDGEQC